MKDIDTVKLSKIERFVNSLSKYNTSELDPDISFECVIGSLFPTCFQKIQDYIKDQYTKGYIEGQKNKI